MTSKETIKRHCSNIWKGVREVTYTHQHRSGKYCPHRTLNLGLERF